jgi:Mrp family chromosome partitioning ATPase
VALGLAYSAARDGVRTLYVDLDLQPHPHSTSGFVDASTHNSSVPTLPRSLSESIRPVPALDRLDILTSAALRESRQSDSLIGSDELKRLLEKLRSSYDLIIVDTAPVLIVEDANWLAPYVDAVLLVARFGKTTEQELITAVARLNMNRAPIIGTVINNVDPRGRSTIEPMGAVSYPRQSRGYFDE